MTLRPLLISFVLGTLTTATALAAPKAAPVEIVSAEFGLFDTSNISNPRETTFTPTAVVPRKEGQRYGWVIDLHSDKRSLVVREEYLLGETADDSVSADAESDSLKIPSQRRRQVSQRQLVPNEGKIYGEWVMGNHEPTGRRHLQVVIEGGAVADFVYVVE